MFPMTSPDERFDWSRLPPDVAGDGSPRRHCVSVPVPPAFEAAIAGLATAHDLDGQLLETAAQLALVARYVGPTVCVAVQMGGTVLDVEMELADTDDLIAVGRRLAAAVAGAAAAGPVSGSAATWRSRPSTGPVWAPVRVGTAYAESSEPGELDLELCCDGSAPEGAAVPVTGRRWLVSTDSRFSRATRAAIASTVGCFLAALGDDPTQALAAVPVLDDATRSRLLVEWNATDVPRRPGELAHHGLEQRAAAAPDDVVAELGARTLTARRLDVAATELAHELLAGGVRPGEPSASPWSGPSSCWWRCSES